MKKLLILLLLSICTLGFTTSEVHRYYVGLAEIDYFSNKKEIQIALKVFTDDLEFAIKQEGKQLYLDTSKEIDNADDYIKKYIDGNFYIKIGGKLQPLQYIGKEYSDDTVWIYLNCKEVAKRTKSFSIKNALLTKYFSQQTNLTHFKLNRTLIKSDNLTKDNFIMMVNF